MKKNIIISLLVAAMGVIAFVGCEKEETIGHTTAIAHQVTDNPQGSTTPVTHNTTLSYTGCHSSQRDGMYDPIVSTNFDNGVLLLNIANLQVNCATDNTISADMEFDAQTIKVNLHQSSYDANCFCPIDVDYSIDNIKPGTYELIITKSDLIFYQEEIICE